MATTTQRTEPSDHYALIDRFQPLRPHHGVLVLLSFVALLLPMQGRAQQESEDVSALFGDAPTISLATGYSQPLSRAPATATILTRADIAALGVRTLKDVLHFMPGFNVSAADGRSTFVTVRGITSRALILVDNIPITRTMIDPWIAFDNVPLHNVERIEVIRGPGSALYGADAVAGVINILTRTGMFGATKEVGVASGWSDSHEAWGLFASSFNNIKLSGYAAYTTTDGSDRIIEADAQTMLDQRFGTQASNAPGPIAQKRRSLDTRLEAAIGNFSAHLTFYDQDPMPTGAGVAYALDPTGNWSSLYRSAQLRYRKPMSDALLIEAFVDVSEVRQDAYANIFPAGAFANAFPDGVISTFLITNQRQRAEATGLWTGLKSHKVRFGAGALTNEFDNVRDVRNFIVRNGRFIATGMLAPFGGVGDAGLISDTKQDVTYLYAQDEWTLADDWWLTTGVRWDRYSDFGSTVNPRLGLVWNARHDLSVKALYGRSFRPPSVLESQSSGVFSALGNPKLKPTTLDMYELGLQYQGTRLTQNFAVFHYKQSDLIQVVPNPVSPNGTGYVNRGENRGWGFETDMGWRFSSASSTSLSYGYQDRIGHEADNNANNRFAPHHILTWQLNLEWTPEWQSSVSARGILDRERPISDPRPNPDDYAVVNFAVTRRGIFKVFDASLIVNNVFDRDVRDASPSATSLPFDIPLPGRTWFAELKWHQ